MNAESHSKPSATPWRSSVAETGRARPTIRVQPVVGGWPHPWPNVEELARVLPADQWTLIGGLMTQLHVINRGFGVVRPTNDVDIVLHIETSRGVPSRTAAALESIGYRLITSIDPRTRTAHRFTRGGSHVDLLASGARDEDGDVAEVQVEKRVREQQEKAGDIVDVLMADHAAPSTEEMLRGKAMVRVEGATQALRRTVNVVLEISPAVLTTISLPGPFGALILKAAAFRTDTRDRARHLYDAAALLACIEDPYAEREAFAGSDRARLRILETALAADHGAWMSLPRDMRPVAQAALRLLMAPDAGQARDPNPRPQ